MTYFGTIGLFLTLLLLFVRFLPVIAAFEINEVKAEEQEKAHG
jgi:molybdopterin-containing oxidoreductase family membrane subunit